MARDYVAVYQRLIEERRTAGRPDDVADFAIPQETPIESAQTIDLRPKVASRESV
jgi:hypothetical protein